MTPAAADGVLLLAYGGPETLDEVEPFLQDIRGGRPTPPALVAEVRERYAAIGDGSPLLANSRAQAAALARELERRHGRRLPVAVGMRHWQPRIATAVEELAAAGVRRLTAICLAPHHSALSVGAYRTAVEAALEALPQPAPSLHFVERWGLAEGYLDALTELLAETLAAGAPAQATTVVFTAHSLPLDLLPPDDPYRTELQATAAAVATRLGLPTWRLAFQSAGARPGAWLGPDLDSVLHELVATGPRDVVVQPIGFVSDHVETLYDLDLEARRQADALGLTWRRVPAPGDHPRLIETLAGLVPVGV